MENAVDALIMGASVLLLIVALTVTMNSLSNFKNGVQDMIMKDEVVELAQDNTTGEYINYFTGRSNDNNGIRSVSAETVITSIRRAKQENYTVYIAGSSISQFINRNRQNLGSTIFTNSKPQYYKDETNLIIPANQNILRITLNNDGYKNIVGNESVLGKLYEEIKDKIFKEYIGIYQEKSDEVSSANKLTYRVITFVEES